MINSSEWFSVDIVILAFLMMLKKGGKKWQPKINNLCLDLMF